MTYYHIISAAGRLIGSFYIVFFFFMGFGGPGGGPLNPRRNSVQNASVLASGARTATLLVVAIHPNQILEPNNLTFQGLSGPGEVISGVFQKSKRFSQRNSELDGPSFRPWGLMASRFTKKPCTTVVYVLPLSMYYQWSM